MHLNNSLKLLLATHLSPLNHITQNFGWPHTCIYSMIWQAMVLNILYMIGIFQTFPDIPLQHIHTFIFYRIFSSQTLLIQSVSSCLFDLISNKHHITDKPSILFFMRNLCFSCDGSVTTTSKVLTAEIRQGKGFWKKENSMLVKLVCYY